MVTEHTMEGKKYTPATDVGRHFGYSKDYILMLIKQGKIEGQKVGNKWFAYLPSAELYFTTAKQDQEIRRKQISEERKAELKKHTRTRSVTHHQTALIETLVIFIIGLSLGVTGYLGTTTATQTSTAIHGNYSFLEQLALSLYTTLTPEEAAVTLSTNTTVPEGTAISAHIGTTTYTSLIIAPDELFTVTDIEDIRNSFADPVSVSVDPNNPDTGIIIPQFRERNGEAYRFLMVPVKMESADTETENNQADTSGSVVSQGITPVTQN